MKSDDRGSHQGCELEAPTIGRVVPGLRWLPLSFIALIGAYQTRIYQISFSMYFGVDG